MLMYYRNPENKELSGFQQKLLMLLRFASIGGAVFLFAMPLVQSLQKITQ